MDWPPVFALIITYRRLELALETIHSVRANVDYPNIGFVLADDGSGANYVDRLCRAIGGSYKVHVTDAARGGVGKSMNLGIAKILETADIWLHLEDDWVLPKPLDLRPSVKLLIEDPGVGMVRLGRLTPGMKAESYSGGGYVWWKLIRNSDTYLFSGNASLRHRRFHDAYGPYPDKKLTPGMTELWYCDRYNSGKGPEIVHPAWYATPDLFQHIGDSQSFKWWMEQGGLSAEEAAAKFEKMGKG